MEFLIQNTLLRFIGKFIFRNEIHGLKKLILGLDVAHGTPGFENWKLSQRQPTLLFWHPYFSEIDLPSHSELQMSWQNEASNKILILDIIIIQRPLVLSFKVGILRRSQILKSLAISFYIQCQKNSEELSSYLPKNNNVGQKRTGLLP